MNLTLSFSGYPPPGNKKAVPGNQERLINSLLQANS